MTAWVDAPTVLQYALVNYTSLNYVANTPFVTSADFDEFLEDYLIPAAQGHINAYCLCDFDIDYPTGIPVAIKDVCARATSNMIQYLVINRTGPLLRVDNWAVSVPVQAVLTPELKALLEPWVKRTPYMKASSYKISFIQDTWDE